MRSENKFGLSTQYVYNLLKVSCKYGCVDNCGDLCQNLDGDYPAWESPGIGRSLLFMAIQGVVFLLILYLLESDNFARAMRALKEHRHHDDTQEDVEMMAVNGVPVTPVEDNDVAAERERIVNTSVEELTDTDAVILRQLTKLYDNSFLAVDRLSVGIPKGECFGLLGVNGAGKTTTFAMLTGDTSISSGDSFLAGMSVVRGAAGARRRLVGFCPQFDALIDQMTVRETLWMYARLRGIDPADIDGVVEKLIDQLTLEKYADRQAGRLRYKHVIVHTVLFSQLLSAHYILKRSIYSSPYMYTYFYHTVLFNTCVKIGKL